MEGKTESRNEFGWCSGPVQQVRCENRAVHDASEMTETRDVIQG